MQHLIKKIIWNYVQPHLMTGHLLDKKSGTAITIHINRIDFKSFEFISYMSNPIPSSCSLYECKERIEDTPFEPLETDFWKKKVLPCFKSALEKTIMEWKVAVKKGVNQHSGENNCKELLPNLSKKNIKNPRR